MATIIYKCYKCGSKNVDVEKSYCNECRDETKLTKLEYA